MALLWFLFVTGIASPIASGQIVAQNWVPKNATQPAALVQSLYQQVLATPSVGIPYGRNLRIFTPYLSSSLLHKMRVARDCGNDWYRRHPDSQNPRHPDRLLKPPFAWLELGTFTGGDDEEDLHAFRIEKTDFEQDGSIQVTLKLTWGTPPERPWSTSVATVLRRENGRFVVDDIIYRTIRDGEADWRLTQALSSGCSGRHWVGYHDSK